MAIADTTALKARMAALMGTAWSTALSAGAQDGAIAQALEELGWVLPVTVSRKAYWLVERCKRHALYITLITQAERFQYKQIKLQDKFDNYFKLIAEADKTFAKALEEDPALLDTADMKAAFMMNPAGFVYDQMGRDLTYVYR